MAKIGDSSPFGSAAKEKKVFLDLEHLLAFYARTTPDQYAILATSGASVTYGQLWARTKRFVRELRRLAVSQGDRVAVVLPRGAECAAVMVAVATGAVCVPLNPDFTADELRRYFRHLKIAALLTQADMNSVSRSVANAPGIPVIGLTPGGVPARLT